jgi:hypothetical protein
MKIDNLDKEFIPYKQALGLKELGFNEPCFGHFLNKKFYLKSFDRQGDGITLRPTYSQAFRFFRKKYNCYHTITLNKKYVGIVYSSVVNFSIDEFDTYEEAELECIKKLIEIVKNK